MSEPVTIRKGLVQCRTCGLFEYEKAFDKHRCQAPNVAKLVHATLRMMTTHPELDWTGVREALRGL